MGINEDINDALNKANRKDAYEQMEKIINDWFNCGYSLQEIYALIEGICYQVGTVGLIQLYKLWATEIDKKMKDGKPHE